MSDHYLAKSYRWQPSEIKQLTETQLAMRTHAAWAASKREETKHKFESTCVKCGEERVIDDICNACGFDNSDRIFNRDQFDLKSKKSIDIIEWPPRSGKMYKGDEHESAIMKLKRDIGIKGMLEYNHWILTSGLVLDPEEVARKKGLI
jgi:ribosomal protein L37E